MTSVGPREQAASVVDPEVKPGGDHAVNAWVVRAGSQGEAESSNLERGRASIGSPGS